jgi:hypothetical protein
MLAFYCWASVLGLLWANVRALMWGECPLSIEGQMCALYSGENVGALLW